MFAKLLRTSVKKIYTIVLNYIHFEFNAAEKWLKLAILGDSVLTIFASIVILQPNTSLAYVVLVKVSTTNSRASPRQIRATRCCLWRPVYRQTYATLAYDMSDIKSAFFFCCRSGTSTVPPIGVNFETVPGVVCPLSRRYPRGSPKSQILSLNFGHLTANISTNGSVTCQLA